MLRAPIGRLLASLIFLPFLIGCDDLASVAKKTKKAAQDVIATGKQAGVFQGDRSQQATPASQMPAYLQVPRSESAIAIGTFNIQVFGTAKLADPDVMGVLVQVARQFDCLAIQEVRSKDQRLIDRFVQMVNADGSRYDFVIGPRQGDTVSKEQYVYLFDTRRIELVSQGFVLQDPHNLLHREPLVSRFRARTGDPRMAFTFALVNVHTDPDLTSRELAALHQAYLSLQDYFGRYEDDVIMLGDFNEWPRNYGSIWSHPHIVAAIPDGVPTNTTKTRGYDNILFDRQMTSEFTGHSGVLDLTRSFGLTLEQAQKVSDHMPVWALFTAHESGDQLATRFSDPQVDR